MQQNISPETILTEKVDVSPYDVTNRTEKFWAAKEISDSLNACLCANGSLFSKDKEGTDKFDKSELFKKYSELIQAKDQFIGSLQQAYLNPRLVDADKAIAFYYEILNMNHDLRDIPKWDGSDINNFIFANDNKIVQKENELIVDELHVKTLSVREYPEELGYLMLLGMPVML